MSEPRTQAIVLLYWGMLASGAVLSGVGLCHRLARFRAWRFAGRSDEGEIVFGDSALGVGQSVTLAPGDRMLGTDPAGVLHGHIASASRRHFSIDLDPDTAGLFLPTLATQSGVSMRAGSTCNTACRLNIGSKVTLSVTAASEIFRFTTRIRDIQTISGGMRLFVARPSVLTRMQRRRHARVGLSVPGTFEPVQSGVRACSPIHGTVRSLSGGGLCAQIGGVMRVHELDHMLGLFAIGSTVRIGLPFPALSRNAVFASIRTSQRAVTPGGLTLQVACEFLPMPAWEQDLVIQHVFQVQREQLRTGKMRRNGHQPGVCQ